MTKLKAPIILTVETVEHAIGLWHRLNASYTHFESYIHSLGKVAHSPWETLKTSHIWNHLDALLRDTGVDPLTWTPSEPFLIAGHEPEFRPDGSVKVGCQDISAEAIEEFLKRREMARKHPESEWPKYYRHNSGVWRANNATDPGASWNGTEWFQDSGAALVYWASNFNWTPITRSEAAAIVGEANL